MLTRNRKQTLYLFRELTLKMMSFYDENYEVYFYLAKNDEIVYISAIKIDLFNNVKIGRMPLIKLFIYMLIEEYPQTQIAQLILISFRIVRHYSIKQLADLLSCTVEQYEKLEAGYYLFQNQFSFADLSKKLNIPHEFFISTSIFYPSRYLE